jgi:hypothetical protein
MDVPEGIFEYEKKIINVVSFTFPLNFSSRVALVTVA